MKVLVYETADGVRINYPNEKLRLRGESDNDFLARIRALNVQRDPSLSSALSVTVLDHTELPDRATRSTWRLRGGRVDAVARA